MTRELLINFRIVFPYDELSACLQQKTRWLECQCWAEWVFVCVFVCVFIPWVINQIEKYLSYELISFFKSYSISRSGAHTFFHCHREMENKAVGWLHSITTCILISFIDWYVILIHFHSIFFHSIFVSNSIRSDPSTYQLSSVTLMKTMCSVAFCF